MAGLIECQAFFNLLPLGWDSEQVSLCEHHFRVESQIPTAPGSPVIERHWFSKPLRGLIILVPRAGVPSVGLEPLIPQEGPLSLGYPLLLLGHLWVLARSLPLLPVSMWFFLYIPNCRRVVLLVFRSFAERVLVCLWEEVSPGSSYSIILI